MHYIVVDNTEWLYPDRTDYATGRDRIRVTAARGGYASAQVLFTGCGGAFTVEAEGLTPELYELVPVYVEANAGLTPENSTPHMPERVAPFWLYDCCKPLRGMLVPNAEGVCGLYFSLPIPRDAEPGVWIGTLRAGDTTVPVEITVSNATIPVEEHLTMIVNYTEPKTCEYHHVTEGSAEAEALHVQYLKLLRRQRQNMLYVPPYIEVTEENGRYRFDFSGLEHFINRALSLGYKFFNLPGIAGRKSWRESTLLVRAMPSMSFEAYNYLRQYLPALHDMLRRNGWLDRVYLEIADEPNDACATEFRALAGLVHKLAPDIKLLDAMSFVPVYGALDVWVPLNAEYDKHQAEWETMREDGSEIWHYVCCGPRGDGYINRLMDIPLLATRYLFWGNYKYNLKGFLHWASNFYQPGQDPFTQNCPEHHNADSVGILPPGDTHILYPGDGEPWMSLRLENQRESAEEFELLRLLAQHDKARADALCARGFRSFRDVEYDLLAFRALREELLAAVAAL